MIQIKNLSKEYQTKKGPKTVFSGFGLHIRKGEKIAVIGPNGSGKSTLFNILSGIDQKYEGNTKVNGKIAYMNQHPLDSLLPWFSCKKNILLSMELAKTDTANAEKKLNLLSNQLRIDFSLEQHPFELSGGQRQLVVLLRSLLLESDVLLLDEPFSALDTHKQKTAVRVLKKQLNKETTILACSHRSEELAPLITHTIQL